MAYQGTTNATPNPPRLLIGGQGSTVAPSSTSPAAGRNLWFYNSTHALSDLVGVGFFTDGYQLGMKQGDVLLAPTYTTQGATGHILVMGMLFSSNTTAGYNISTAGSITSTFS
jgi:hypothetical protein